MTNEEFANYLFPNVQDVSYYENKYKKRNLKEGAIVTRYAPSPTGSIHMGNLFQAFISKQYARQSGGIFFLRVEDTDQKREVENGIEGIVKDVESFGINFDEGYGIGGEYGPYLQSERGDIYAAYVKYLVAKGLAYPCFCSSSEIDENRTIQESTKERIGYYGRWATCRDLTPDTAKEKIEAGNPYIFRMKSRGDFNKKHVYHDAIKGDLEYPENDMDNVILKSDGLPTYHFAHAIDDHLMGTTHVIRGDEWVSSLPVHLELFDLLGFKTPQYAHLAPLLKKDGDVVRKLSKRKDPEASVRYYHELGIPVDAIKLYLSTVGNTNFEEWYLANPDKNITDFTFQFDKMSVGGTMFDLAKLENISKVYFSVQKADKIYDEVLNYSKQYDLEFANILEHNKDYTISLLNIEREIERPRKDIGAYPSVRKEFWYMYDELFNKEANPYQDIAKNYQYDDLITYMNTIYLSTDTEEEWFGKVKDFAGTHGYAINRKDYKADPSSFKGQVSDFCELIRVMATTKTISPNLYDILKLLGNDRLKKRLELFARQK
ncbi:MAG: glutamate--tRNA ligase [Bacilli bacterium]